MNSTLKRVNRIKIVNHRFNPQPILSQINSSCGFSVIEMVVMSAVLLVLMLSSASMMTNLFRSSKQLDLKAGMTGARHTVEFSTQNSALGRIAFDIDNPALPGLDKALLDNSGVVAYVYDKFPTFTIPPNQVIKMGDEISSGLLLNSLKITFTGAVTPGSTYYLGRLTVNVGKKVATQGTFELQPFDMSIWVQTKPSAVNPATEYQFKEVYTTPGSMDPGTVCKNLGGRWLESTDNGTNPAMTAADMISRQADMTDPYSNDMVARCPVTNLLRPRCAFGSQYDLMPNELPDNIACDGGTNKLGERAMTCHYQRPKETFMREAVCRSFSLGRGDQCLFDAINKRWELHSVVIKLVGGNPVKSTKLKYVCTGGASFGTFDDGEIRLNWNDRLHVATGIAAPGAYDPGSGSLPGYDTANEFSITEQLTLLPVVEKCYSSYSSDKFWSCKNPEDIDTALEGRGGSCIYVHNIKLINPSNSVQKGINQCIALATSSGLPTAGADAECPPPIDGTNNYTGWIYVNSNNPRAHFSVAATRGGGNNALDDVAKSRFVTREARGYPCYQVSVNVPAAATIPAGLVNDPNIASNDNATVAPNNAARTDVEKVVACLVNNADIDGNGRRKSLIKCVNPTEDLSAITAADDPPEVMFKKDSCWFMSEDPQNRVLKVQKYRGWVAFNGPLPTQAEWVSNPNPARSRIGSSGAAAVNYPSVPCYDGVLVGNPILGQ